MGNDWPQPAQLLESQVGVGYFLSVTKMRVFKFLLKSKSAWFSLKAICVALSGVLPRDPSICKSGAW